MTRPVISLFLVRLVGGACAGVASIELGGIWGGLLAVSLALCYIGHVGWPK